jgi:exoribonuclease R
MPRRQFRIRADHATELRRVLADIRTELEVPDEFPAAVHEEVAEVLTDVVPPELDLTGVPFVTIDPPESMDLDQALHLSRDGDGFLVRYAISDVALFVRPGGAIDAEAHRRGVTFYGPDGKAPLHAVELSEGAASLLPDQDRPANVWEIRLDPSGAQRGDAVVRKALVRSRAKLNYREVQDGIDAGAAGEMLELLPVIGRLRQEQERERGGVSLPLPDQEIVDADGHLGLDYRYPLPVEGWNAQISLLTGIAAGALMRQAGVGILRTLPDAASHDLTTLRRTAKALHIDWPAGVPYAELVPQLDADRAAHAAFLNAAAGLFRGSGYVAFTGEPPEESRHAAIAAEYAHVTAPLRRLVDRYALEVCVAACAGEDVPDWVRDALPKVPDVMAGSSGRASSYEGACVSVVEAAVLAGREGEQFEGVIVDVDPRDERGVVVIDEPAIRGRINGANLPLGEKVRVQLHEASIDARRIAFTLS